jgi:peroxiredoxin
MLAVDDAAPDFDLDGTDGTTSGAYRLSAAAERAPVLVAFYRDDFDSDCRRYLEALRDTDWGSLTDTIAVFGVAPGTLEDHRQLARELDLPFPLLVDHSGVDGQFGVQRPDGSTRRAAFLVDRRCRVRFAWAEGEADESPPIDRIHSAITRL